MKRRIGVLAGLGALSAATLGVFGCEGEKPPSASSPAASTAAAVAPTASASAVGSGDADVEYARQLTARFGGALKEALMKGMSAGGPVNAIQVCSEQAPAIAKSIDVAKGWSIRRTSLKLRSPDNAPDEWERGVLERFEKKRAAGSKADELEEHAIVDEGGTKRFRYMKAIGTAALCLNCHGGQLTKEVIAAVDERYPNDQARGFQVGDLRGAFSIAKSL